MHVARCPNARRDRVWRREGFAQDIHHQPGADVDHHQHPRKEAIFHLRRQRREAPESPHDRPRVPRKPSLEPLNTGDSQAVFVVAVGFAFAQRGRQVDRCLPYGGRDTRLQEPRMSGVNTSPATAFQPGGAHRCGEVPLLFEQFHRIRPDELRAQRCCNGVVQIDISIHTLIEVGACPVRL